MSMGDAPRIRFRALERADLAMLHEWLSRPHVVEWWEPAPTMRQVEDDYRESLDGDQRHRCYIALDERGPIGFIQSYVPAAFHADGWWLGEHDPGVRGIDQFLADPDRLGQGLGTAMVREFVTRLFDDPAVTRIQTDPDPANARAIRAYEKVGFRAAREITSPDGRALLMYLERPRPSESRSA
jgi:RimJ/RimL family protein N-acetyltransferase